MYMSEAEKQRRLAYKQNRQKRIIIQIAVMALLAALTLTMTLIFISQSKAYHVSYTESGSADYIVNLKDNEFYTDGSLAGGQGYIAELINEIGASFRYTMLIDAGGVTYDYRRHIEARLEITDKKTEKLLYAPTYPITDEVSGTSQNGVSVTEFASIKYGEYNAIAKRFIDTYHLSYVDSRLIVTMYVSVNGTGKELAGQTHNEYAISVMIPLCESTLDIQTSTSQPSGETKLLSCRRDVNPAAFQVLAIVFGVLTLAAAGFMAVFLRLTRNEDIDYRLRVKRLLSAYRSYIQVITCEFDSEGYQILTLSTFNEMLGIRDTIQSPILMHENEDQTRTVFLIPTNTKILYAFEVKVDDYDLLYGQGGGEDEEEPAVAEAEEEPAVLEESDCDREEGMEVIDVAWPEHEKKNKVYKYDPDGEALEKGDIVLVPSYDKHQDRDIIRQAAVMQGNYRVAAETIRFPLKKIVGVVKRGLQSRLDK